MQLAVRAAAAGVGLTTYRTLASTNAEALAYARRGENGPLWITADIQTDGRGRRGRVWISEPGNLHASLLLTEPAPPGSAAQLSFVAALAVHDALAASAGALAPRLALKWPNDLLLDGAKLAGILIEGEGDRRFSVVIGIGINIRQHPAGTEFPATDLAAHGTVVTAAQVFAALSECMMDRLAQWGRGEGFAAIREDWLARAAGLGKPIRVRLPDTELTGRFGGLDATGRLLLETPDGKVAPVAAGDVFPLDSQPGTNRAADNR
jgi:BirA family transcriptional regulator, biotin operon repressor / biotin---[acetyl-CoA-carboxylase] ligase